MAEYYNNEIKQRFLDSIDLSKYPPGWWDRMFAKTKLFEERKGFDIYDFSTSDLMEFYKFLEIGNVANLIAENAKLIAYGEWALNEHLISDNQIHFYELRNTDIMSKCVSKARIYNSILTKTQLKHIHFLNYQDAFVFWALFEGIKGKNYEEIINLSVESIDQTNRKVKLCTGREMMVSDEFISMAINANKETEYTVLNKVDSTIQLLPSLTIYKERHNSRGVDIPRSVYALISRNLQNIDGLNNDITSKSLRDSGLIHYLNERGQQVGIPAKDLLYNLDKIDDLLDKYYFNPFVRKKWLLTYSEYLK